MAWLSNGGAGCTPPAQLVIIYIVGPNFSPQPASRCAPPPCSILFPSVDVIPICVLFDRERLTAALNLEGALRLRWLGLRVPLLAQLVIELGPRRERGAAAGTLCIT